MSKESGVLVGCVMKSSMANISVKPTQIPKADDTWLSPKNDLSHLVTDTPDVKKYVQKLWLGRVHDLELEKQVAKVLTTAIEEARRERDSKWLLYLTSWHRAAHDDLYDDGQEDNPMKDYDYHIIDRLTDMARAERTNSQPSIHYQPKAN